MLYRCTAAPHRFSCRARQYKYFIVQDGALDVAAMRAAAQHLLGEHDFRNFCKADVLQVRGRVRGGVCRRRCQGARGLLGGQSTRGAQTLWQRSFVARPQHSHNPQLHTHTHMSHTYLPPPVTCVIRRQVKNYIRRVLDVSIDPVATACPSMSVVALHIRGTAFLWHQVRMRRGCCGPWCASMRAHVCRVQGRAASCAVRCNAAQCRLLLALSRRPQAHNAAAAIAGCH